MADDRLSIVYCRLNITEENLSWKWGSSIFIYQLFSWSTSAEWKPWKHSTNRIEQVIGAIKEFKR